ncbi:hypothetical protein [Streptomyces nigra]
MADVAWGSWFRPSIRNPLSGSQARTLQREPAWSPTTWPVAP